MVRWWLELEWAFFVDLPLHYTYLAFYYQDNYKTNMQYPLRTLDRRVQGISANRGIGMSFIYGFSYLAFYYQDYGTYVGSDNQYGLWQACTRDFRQ